MKINLGKKQIVIDGILTDMEQNRIIKQNTSRNNNKNKQKMDMNFKSNEEKKTFLTL